MRQLKEIIKKRIRDNRGFTLIEAIAVLVILSIIAAVVMTRGGSSAEATLKSSAEALKGHIRFAQMRALNSDAPACTASVGMIISSSDGVYSYSMFTITGSDCTPSNAILPGAENTSGINLPSGMTVTTTSFSFDRWGRPSIAELSTLTTVPDPATTDIDLSLTYAGLTENIKITKNTGFVP